MTQQIDIRTSLAYNATGVVRPCEGQEDCFSGVDSCSVFKLMLVNSLDPIRYSKIAFQGSSDAALASVTVLAQSRTAFVLRVGDVSTATAGSAGYVGVLNESHTNYFNFEDPVPLNCNLMFCAVGLAVSAERPFVGDASHAYPSWLSAFPDIRETIREDVLDNTFLNVVIGNNGCNYRVGLAKHFGASAEPKGADIIVNSLYASPLDFVCFNAVVCIDSLQNNRRATIGVTLGNDLVVTSSTAPVTTSELVRIPLELQLYGFIVSYQGNLCFQGPSPTLNRA